MSGVVYCGCGHTLDQHIRGAVCRHVNAASKRFPTSAPCGCRRFHPNPGLPDSDEFVAKQVNHLRTKMGLDLEPVEREELTQVMTIALWAASGKYDSRSHIPFGSFAVVYLQQRAIDELRSSRMFGRHGQHRLPPPLPSLTDDDAWHVDPVDPVEEDDSPAVRYRRSRLDRIIPELVENPPDVRDIDLGWALDQEHRRTSRDQRKPGSSAGEIAPSGTRGSAWHRGLAAFVPSTEEAA